MSFEALGLSEESLRAVADSGYNDPTPIQRQAIPPVLMGRDIIGVAQTGTGKTASFVLPMIDILAQGRARARMPRSLILEPTRELAQQVAENFDKYGKYHKLSMALLIGGVAMGDQLSALEKGVDVLIATPGRLMDLFGRGKIMLNACSMLVIDEADRMLDMGFIPDIEEICTKLPAVRQTLLFSATMPGPIKKLADRFMSEPRMIEVARPASTNASIAQFVVNVTPRGKREALRELLRDPEVKNAIVFCNRKRDIKELVESLRRAGFPVSQIHGDMEQSDRIRELDRFKSGDISIIVASDVAARGLDIPGVSHVVNYDVPHHAEDYVHRIGRTGRAGRTGIAYTLATDAEAENLAEVEKLIRQSIPRYGAKEAVVEADAVVAEDAGDDTHATPTSAASPRKRRRRGGRKLGEQDVRVVVTDLAPVETIAQLPEHPREPAGRRSPEAQPPARAGEPGRNNRGGSRADDGRRDTRRDDRRNEPPANAGFGPDGPPAFMLHKATLA